MNEQISNPVKITRLEMVKQHENTVINLHTNGAQFAKYPVLQLFSSSFGMLAGAGIDPNALEVGSVIYCDVMAEWRPSTDKDGKPRLNGKGNQRINPTRLYSATSNAEPAQPSSTLLEIHAMLAHIIDNPDSGLSSAAVIAKLATPPPVLEMLKAGAKIIVQGEKAETPAILESVNRVTFAAVVAGTSYNLGKERFLRVA